MCEQHVRESDRQCSLLFESLEALGDVTIPRPKGEEGCSRAGAHSEWMLLGQQGAYDVTPSLAPFPCAFPEASDLGLFPLTDGLYLDQQSIVWWSSNARR
jgi:hypothetical protein